MACSWEGRRQKHQRGAGMGGTVHVSNGMGGAGHRKKPRRAYRARPETAPEMNARAKRQRHSDIACHHQHKPALAADPRKLPAKPQAIRMPVMPEDDPRQPTWQTGGCGQWISHPPGIGKHP